MKWISDLADVLPALLFFALLAAGPAHFIL